MAVFGSPEAEPPDGAALEDDAELAGAPEAAGLLAGAEPDDAGAAALDELLEVLEELDAGVLLEPQALAVRASTANPAMTPVRLKALRVVTTRTSSSSGHWEPAERHARR